VIIDNKGFSEFAHLTKEQSEHLPARGITELDRLSFVVSQIDVNCLIVPKGSFKLIPLGEIRRNEAFKGLSIQDAFELKNYVHLRSVQQREKKEQLLRGDSVFNHDFLDEATKDFPINTWTVMSDTLKTTSVLRSKLWPGFYAFHRSNSSIHGCMYFGNGLKNLDIPFQF